MLFFLEVVMSDRKHIKDKIETRFNTKNISNRYPLEYADDEYNDRPENDVIIKNLNSRLKLKNIKKSSIISYCEEIDINNDGIIHINDLEIILNHFLKKRINNDNYNDNNDKLNIREKKQLYKYLHDNKKTKMKDNNKGNIDDHSYSNGSINYMKLLLLFPDNTFNTIDENNHIERWYDNDADDHHHKYSNSEQKWAIQKGSVGEFLKNAACPSEISNFHIFISCIEDYERRSGMKCVSKDGGIIVPIGPDLKASVSYFMR